MERFFAKKKRFRRRGEYADPIKNPYRRIDGDRANRSKFLKSKGQPRGRGKKHLLFLMATSLMITGADGAELISFPDFFDFSPAFDGDWRFYEHPG